MQDAVSQALQALLRCEAFSKLKPAELRELANLGEYHMFHEGDGVAIEGEPDDRMFIVQRGSCMITQVLFVDVLQPCSVCAGQLVAALLPIAMHCLQCQPKPWCLADLRAASALGPAQLLSKHAPAGKAGHGQCKGSRERCVGDQWGAGQRGGGVLGARAAHGYRAHRFPGGHEGAH